RGKDRIGTDRRPDDRGEIALGVDHADDAHRSVYVEEDAVDRKDRAQAFDELRLDRVVEVALDRATGQSARMNEGQPFEIARQLVSREKIVAANHSEIAGTAPVWRERARLDVDPA